MPSEFIPRIASGWDIESVRPGDYIRVEVVNKRGDCNLDGATISGIVKEVVVSHRMVRLDSGWCCHAKDLLIEHRRAEEGAPRV